MDIPDDLIIYHYTSASTLGLILEHQTLRATCLAYLNDSTEVQHGLGILVEWLKEREVEYDTAWANGSISMDEHFDRMGFVRGMLTTAYNLKMRNFYGVCFSKNPDVLSQWRGYADHGRGYAIGFRAHELLNSFTCRWLRMSDVSYEKSKLIENCEQLMDHRDKVGCLYYEAVYLLVSGIKDETFAEESECRLVLAADCNSGPLKAQNGQDYLDFRTAVKFFPRDTVLVPYVDMGLFGGVDRLPIEHILIGPGVTNKDNAEASIELLLRKKGYEVGENMIKRSRVPFVP